jgi:hypothetical protein
MGRQVNAARSCAEITLSASWPAWAPPAARTRETAKITDDIFWRENMGLLLGWERGSMAEVA